MRELLGINFFESLSSLKIRNLYWCWTFEIPSKDWQLFSSSLSTNFSLSKYSTVTIFRKHKNILESMDFDFAIQCKRFWCLGIYSGYCWYCVGAWHCCYRSWFWRIFGKMVCYTCQYGELFHCLSINCIWNFPEAFCFQI